MKWSWKLGEIAGIGVYVHATFLILVVWIGFNAWSEGQTPSEHALSMTFLLTLFVCIVLHELGHALAARRYDIQTRDITLLPIGGLARLERMPDDPKQELVVALAGPAVNLAIAAVLAIAIKLSGTFDPTASLTTFGGPFVERVFVVNIFIAVFNLLPAFPMDGGRALRAILASRMEYVAATQIAAHVGQAMALGFGLIGLIFNPILLFIALFVWIGASAEANFAQMKSALSGIPVAHAMLSNFETVAPTDSLARAVEITLHGWQKDIPILEDETVTGILTQSQLK